MSEEVSTGGAWQWYCSRQGHGEKTATSPGESMGNVVALLGGRCGLGRALWSGGVGLGHVDEKEILEWTGCEGKSIKTVRFVLNIWRGKKSS